MQLITAHILIFFKGVNFSCYLVFIWSFMKDQAPYRGEGPLYMQGWWAFGFLSWLFFCWWCKDGAFPPQRGFVCNRKPTFFPPLSLSLTLLPSTGRKEMEFFNYEPITVNKRICINPGVIESLHKTTTSFPCPKTSIPRSKHRHCLSLSQPYGLLLSPRMPCSVVWLGTSTHTWLSSH